MTPFLDSSEILGDAEALRLRMGTEGYLYFSRLLPDEPVKRLRQRILGLADTHGWLKSGFAVDDAIAEPAAACEDPEPAYLNVYRQVYRLEELHTLQHHPRLVKVIGHLLVDEVLVHPRLIQRSIFPQAPDYTTPAHQDHPHVQGPEETYTAWIPIGDVPSRMGGLQVAAGSHQAGIQEYRLSRGAGGLEVVDRLEGKWRGGDFKLGDVLIFHGLTVHRGTPNHSGSIRLSMDARYQRVRDPVVDEALLPVGNIWTWEEIYQDWTSDALKYYWRRFALRTVPFDPAFYEWRDNLAFDAAARGDTTARAVLLRIAQRTSDATKRERALTGLAQLDSVSRSNSRVSPN